MTIRSKHNNLLNYFLYDEKDLSKAYVRKCKNFIDNIRSEIHIENLKELKKQMVDPLQKVNRKELKKL